MYIEVIGSQCDGRDEFRADMNLKGNLVNGVYVDDRAANTPPKMLEILNTLLHFIVLLQMVNSVFLDTIMDPVGNSTVK